MLAKLAIAIFSGAVVAQILPATQAGWGPSLTVVLAISGAVWRISSQLKKFHTDFLLIMVEHEMLVTDYCERKDMEVGELPTRQGNYKARGMGAD